jgi:hypothetical protein
VRLRSLSESCRSTVFFPSPLVLDRASSLLERIAGEWASDGADWQTEETKASKSSDHANLIIARFKNPLISL